jgi:hypothetical protein
MRGIAVAAAVLFGVVALAASGETDDDSGGSDGDAGDATDNDVSQGGGSADASADVSVPQIVREGEGEFGIAYGEVTITNNSSERSDYFVTIVAESPDGATRHDETVVMVIDLEPGQSTTERGMFPSDVPDDAVLKLTEVQRTAST